MIAAKPERVFEAMTDGVNSWWAYGYQSPQSTVHLEPHAGGTRVKLSHQVMGAVDEAIRQGYTSGWQALLGGHLRRFVEEVKSFREA